MGKTGAVHSNEFGRFQFKIRFIADSLSILTAWIVAYYVRFYLMSDGSTDSVRLFVVLAVFAWASGIFFLHCLHLYEMKFTSHWRREIYGLFLVSLFVFLTFVVVYYFVFYYKISRLHLLLFWFFLFVFFVGFRLLANRYFAHLIRKGKFRKNVLLVGYGERIKEYYAAAVEHKETGMLEVRGLYLGGKDFRLKGVKNIEAVSLSEAVEKTDADVVVIGFPDVDFSNQFAVVRESMELINQRVFILPYVPHTYVGLKYGDFHHIPVMEVNSYNMTTGKRFIKRVFDLVSCLFAVTVLSPLFLIIAFLVKVTSKGPVLFKQERVTIDNKPFTMYKFRSMRTDIEEKGGAHWTEENDPRITRLGRFLRRTSLDELPQFFNVIGGSMSLIGPRPERPELEIKFKEVIPGYNMRHRMKAGISGWAQVNGLRGNTSLEKRVEYDLFYIRNWSFLLDIKIIVLTFFKGFINKNAY